MNFIKRLLNKPRDLKVRNFIKELNKQLYLKYSVKLSDPNISNGCDDNEVDIYWENNNLKIILSLTYLKGIKSGVYCRSKIGLDDLHWDFISTDINETSYKKFLVWIYNHLKVCN